MIIDFESSCDQCSVARAKYRVVVNGGEILLCGHHFDLHEQVILDKDYEVLDFDGDLSPVS